VDTSQNERQTRQGDREVTDTERRRQQHQREQVEAHASGDIGSELKAFAKEFIDDQAQFPRDVVEDSKDPDRRLNEEQADTTQGGAGGRLPG
jgi:hypothetical protein